MTILSVPKGAPSFCWRWPVVPASAQYNNQQQQLPKDANGITLNAQLVKTGLYLFSSESSNTLLRLSANGLILVDGQPLAACDMLRARVRKSRTSPSVALILTDLDASHTGCNAKFLESHAKIVAQENLKHNLIAVQSSQAPTALRRPLLMTGNTTCTSEESRPSSFISAMPIQRRHGRVLPELESRRRGRFILIGRSQSRFLGGREHGRVGRRCWPRF